MGEDPYEWALGHDRGARLRPRDERDHDGERKNIEQEQTKGKAGQQAEGKWILEDEERGSKNISK